MSVWSWRHPQGSNSGSVFWSLKRFEFRCVVSVGWDASSLLSLYSSDLGGLVCL